MISSYQLFELQDKEILSFIIFISFPIRLLTSYFVFKKMPETIKKFQAILIYTVIYLIVESAIYFLLYTYGNSQTATLYLRFRFQFVYFFTVAAFIFCQNRSLFGTVFYSPANALVGIIWPTSTSLCHDDYKLKKNLWVRGLVNILIGIFAIILREIFETYIVNKLQLRISKSISFYGLSFFSIIGHLNIISGVARLYGMQIIDTTKFLFLASSPADFWRRANVYPYIFIKNTIYLQLIKKIKNQFVTLFLSFLFFVVYKTGFINLLSFINKDFVLSYYNLVKTTRPLEIFLHHGVFSFALIYFSPMIFNKRFFPNHSLKSWIPVLFTHLAMSSLYYFTYLVIQYIL